MVLQFSKLFYCKVSGGFLRKYSESSYSFGKIQNVGVPEVLKKKFGVSLGKGFIFCFHINFFH